jgi:CheY-like chemotaxis protein
MLERQACVEEGRRVTRVMVIEDEPDLRRVVVEALSDEGYDVMDAADGVAALELVREQPPELVLLDLMMPNLDGPGFLRACRADPRTAAVPVVVATAAHDAQLDGLDAQAVVTKPFNLGELIDIVVSLAPV